MNLVLLKPSLITEMFLPPGCSTRKVYFSIRVTRHRVIRISSSDVNFNNSVEQRVESNFTKPAPVITTIKSPHTQVTKQMLTKCPGYAKNAPSEMRTNHF